MFYQRWYVACGLQDSGFACGRGKWLVAASQAVTEIKVASCSRKLLVATISNLCFMCLTRVPTTFDTFPCRSKGQHNVICVRTEHTLHVEVLSDGSVRDKDRVWNLLSDDVKVLIASINGNIEAQQDECVVDEVDPARTTLMFLFCHLRLPKVSHLHFGYQRKAVLSFFRRLLATAAL